MHKTFRASMTWLHTWCGLLLGWLLYAIFVTGTASYYRPEITQWMQPELRPHVAAPSVLLERALAEVRRQAPDATTIYIRFPSDRDPGLQLNWETPDGKRTTKVVDAETARLTARDSRGGEFFYRFHFQLQLPYPWGRFIACIAAAFMLVALFTGIVAHRQFFKDFFTFRPSKPGARSWLDAHNLAGVIALPFYFMIAYSAQIMLLDMFMPWSRMATEPPALVADAPQKPAKIPSGDSTRTAGDSVVAPTAKPALPAPLPVAAMAKAYALKHGDTPLAWLYASGLGTPAARLSLGPGAGRGIAYNSAGTVNLDAVTGVPIPEDVSQRGAFAKLHDTLYGLHMVRFARPALRGLFFFLGLLGTLLVATGLIMWSVKRRKRQESLHGPGRAGFGHALVERLNITTIVGFPLALASIFWANRLLPVGMEARGDREVGVVFVVWSLALLHACVRPAWKAWREQLIVASGLFGLLPFLDALTTPAASTRLVFNLGLLSFGGVFAWAALRVSARARSRTVSRDHENDHSTAENTPEVTA